MSVRALLISAYDAGSHARWRRQLVAHLPELSWEVLTLPPRHFSWRARGNSYSLAFERGEALARGYDVAVVTSMCDLSALRGFVPSLATTPTLVYSHENQLAYPVSGKADARNDVHLKLLNLYTLLCADRALFNSAFNRDTCLSGLRALLQRLPDHAPLAPLDALATRSVVTPVPLEDDLFITPRAPDEAAVPHLVWNQRWEYDRAPEVVIEALERLSARGVAFRLHLLGQRFRKIPEALARAEHTLSAHLDTYGFVEDRAAYLKTLRRSHIVISASRHEFQGLAVQEAIASGCHPVAPDRMAYPEYIAAADRYRSTPDAPDAEVAALTDHLHALITSGRWHAAPDRATIEPLRWSRMADTYRAHLRALLPHQPPEIPA